MYGAGESALVLSVGVCVYQRMNKRSWGGGGRPRSKLGLFAFRREVEPNSRGCHDASPSGLRLVSVWSPSCAGRELDGAGGGFSRGLEGRATATDRRGGGAKLCSFFTEEKTMGCTPTVGVFWRKRKWHTCSWTAEGRGEE